MELPVTCLNEGFVIKGYFTADSWMSLISVYLKADWIPLPITSEQHRRKSQTLLLRHSSPLSSLVRNLKICLTQANPTTSSFSTGTWGFIVSTTQTAWKCKVNPQPNQHKPGAKGRTRIYTGMFSLKNSCHRCLFWKHTEIDLIWRILICL